jgi:uncharacterized protein (DUF1501 family)
MSEFGRTVRQNVNNGTDHGHGNVALVMGGGVADGQVLEQRFRLTDNELAAVLPNMTQRQRVGLS